MSENAPNQPDTTPAAGQDSVDEMTAAVFLSALQGATQRQLDMLRIITNPAYNSGVMEGETPDEIASAYEEFGGYMDDHEREVDIVSDFLYGHYAAMSDMPGFMFGFDGSVDGTIGGFRVAISIERPDDWANRLTLSSWGDIKNSTYDREATGLEAALAIAEALDDHYQSLIVKARKRGLLPVNPDVLADAKAALDSYDAVAANEDVDADTVAALRDSLAAMITAQAAGSDTDD